MASSIVPGIYKEELLDGKISVSTEDAYDMVETLEKKEGILAGQSSIILRAGRDLTDPPAFFHSALA